MTRQDVHLDAMLRHLITGAALAIAGSLLALAAMPGLPSWPRRYKRKPSSRPARRSSSRADG
jgi:hypothetical protein